MTGEMIEYVAKAIEDVDISFSIELTDLRDGVAHYTLRYRSTGESIGFGSHDEAYAYHADRLKRAQARAAIEAMREPTEAMLRQGVRSAPIQPDVGYDDERERRQVREIWEAMIDAARGNAPD